MTKVKLANRKTWMQELPTRWEKAATTEQVLEAFAGEGLNISDPDGLIPFDVLAPADWPPLNGPQRVGVFLAAYGLSLDVVDGQPTVVRNPEIESARVIEFVSPDLDMPKEFDGLWKKSRRGKVILEGTVDRIAAFVAWQVESQKPDVDPDQIKTFSINVTESRGSILKALANQTNRKFVFEQNCVETLNEKVTVSVKDLPFADLVAKCVSGSQLKIEISDTEVRVKKQ